MPEKKNKTGLPDNLKAGIEQISGLSMHDVKVHYNSDAPAQLKSHAYAQGSDIHIAPVQLSNKGVINEDTNLEKVADDIGAKASVAIKSK